MGGAQNYREAGNNRGETIAGAPFTRCNSRYCGQARRVFLPQELNYLLYRQYGCLQGPARLSREPLRHGRPVRSGPSLDDFTQPDAI